MNLSKLNLNRSLVQGVIAEHVKTLDSVQEKGRNEVHYKATLESGESILLILYYNVDATTSISPSGKNQDLARGIAETVVKRCLYSEKSNISLFLPLDSGDYEAVVEYLKSECDATEIEKKDILGGSQLKLSGPSGDQLVLKYFTKKSNLQVQGKPLSLYEELISILCELLPYEDFVSSQLNQVKVDISPEIVKGELESRLPHAYNYLSEKIRAIISPALSLNKLDIELDDYTPIAMPVLRGLEGYLKQVLAAKGYPIARNFSSVIDGSGGCPCVQEAVKTAINCSNTVLAVEKCYAYWASQRHGLFHVDSIVETSRTLNRDEASAIIEHTLELIESTYTAIPS
ncbi:Bacterial toxin RNase RnlA/LsoA DBD domain-containing protein [Vibrio crassostreae]|uniref:type II toxin-antitoxin system RnlA family toxin n=1 Tax=Vibrio crassostreae TaxID=246167 RepID=UPI00148B3634|nr:type II toxin-antitoxin system RnlA family toxin [Vibrio crassostreae]NOH76077.1 hypothetical protein [Vibrio crassostreae]CAK2474396.1 Bacterial toxin RNase RnlA/LsoA DBD domain-containing protein [Vibrio crassostreae]CAK2783236.1 Bacterial toxin RNase RnlA/LsoA DBD domain-containing protein [Vibrio crassostreae]CAK3392582.1 Bacterial toxin RNase RnlA/LsoA DBD domain-containing protein [Vibrio crassostreae]